MKGQNHLRETEKMFIDLHLHESAYSPDSQMTLDHGSISKQLFCPLYQFLHRKSSNLTFLPRDVIFSTNSFIVCENFTLHRFHLLFDFQPDL